MAANLHLTQLITGQLFTEGGRLAVNIYQAANQRDKYLPLSTDNSYFGTY